MRKQVGSSSPWEDIVGYSRAVRIGNHIEVAGTTTMDGDVLIGKDDVYAQTKFIFQKIAIALQQVGSSVNDVVRTRMFVTDISKWEEIGKAHGEVFKNIKPVSSMIEISQLISKDILIEIEVVAIVQ